ncbi:FAD/NAD-P-binding domain-containing protein [Vararia minispora EC-137]|uniref:FAD/NAD-P-binding domain-containing protein n=1 Tax=Vararia minispora EC-137 TaxID=1314806 RepID=A0ACB8QSD2_9AGAM|nr:FAD/NAD-P-binding domain-containing protein [Vararia minispora EC-137]
MHKVCVLGSGFAGLITAQVLLSDGFDVEVVSQDASPGGVWSRERVYPDLQINNVHGEFRFSCLPMPPPKDATVTGGRLSGEDMCAYAETFVDKFLSGRMRYKTLVTRVRRVEEGGWLLDVKDLKTGEIHELRYTKLALCTGGCHTPSIPDYLAPEAARRAGFSGAVLHSRDLGPEFATLLQNDGHPKKFVIIGGGKSAQDAAKNFVKAGHRATMIFEKADTVLAAPIPLPSFIRRSRQLSVFHAYIVSDVVHRRFLHTTRVGAAIVHGTFSTINALSVSAALGIPSDSPLRNAHSMFWDIRLNDEGTARDGSFFALANAGKIDLVAPARASGYAPGGSGVILEDGRTLAADVVILATGYTSSWGGILGAFLRLDLCIHLLKSAEDDVREELGLNRRLQVEDDAEFDHLWNEYTSLANPPRAAREAHMVASIYRGLVPAANLGRRDFAINGAIFTTNSGYTFEVGAHWISSYFLRDAFLKLPPTPEDALTHARMTAAWLRRRHPRMLGWANESYSSGLAFWNWPQLTDELLADMGLRTHRSGGSWLTWPFAVIDLSEIATLGEERRVQRALLRDRRSSRVL